MYINLTTGQRSDTLPRTIESGSGIMHNPPLEACAPHGWREMGDEPDTPEGYIRTGIEWMHDSDNPLKAMAVLSLKTQAEFDAQNAALAQQIAQEQAARFAALCEQIGGFVQSIRRNLVILGYDLPASANEIVADITARSLRDELTDEQDRARSRLADVYVILSNKGIGDAEINAVWEAIK